MCLCRQEILVRKTDLWLRLQMALQIYLLPIRGINETSIFVFGFTLRVAENYPGATIIPHMCSHAIPPPYRWQLICHFQDFWKWLKVNHTALSSFLSPVWAWLDNTPWPRQRSSSLTLSLNRYQSHPAERWQKDDWTKTINWQFVQKTKSMVPLSALLSMFNMPFTMHNVQCPHNVEIKCNE